MVKLQFKNHYKVLPTKQAANIDTLENPSEFIETDVFIHKKVYFDALLTFCTEDVDKIDHLRYIYHESCETYYCF